ncbi:hypothetical protein GOODEAATRI_023025 [Goodea atripinnis]|uniref:Uncharacterized protein n=1 Tax=Goodea atripinnis TaxID=208336 RepID=A0ABV0PGE1_9TELE
MRCGRSGCIRRTSSGMLLSCRSEAVTVTTRSVLDSHPFPVAPEIPTNSHWWYDWFVKCKELVLATVRAFFDLIDAETRQVLILSLSDLASVTHLVVSASNLNGKQALRFCGPMVPVYTAVTLLLACGGQLSTILKSGRAADMSQMVGRGLQPHKINLPVYLLHILLSCSRFQEILSIISVPPEDTFPPTFPDGVLHERAESPEEWPHLLSPLLYLLGAAVAYWGSALLRFLIRLISLTLAPLHRYSYMFKP